MDIKIIDDGDKVLYVREDGYLNATALCKNAGKEFSNWHRLNSTKDFLHELCSVLQIPQTSLVQVSQGGTPEQQGTWLHPDAGPNLAQWLSAAYAVWVSMAIRQIHLNGEPIRELPTTPELLRRLADVEEIREQLEESEREATKKWIAAKEIANEERIKRANTSRENVILKDNAKQQQQFHDKNARKAYQYDTIINQGENIDMLNSG